MTTLRFLSMVSVLASIAFAQGIPPVTLHAFNGVWPASMFGFSVKQAGDVNGDGLPDVVVGAPFAAANGTWSGSATVFSGFDGSTLLTFDGPFQSLLGWSVSGAGDVNADGFADVIAGAPGDNPNGYASGSVTVFSGLDGSVLYNIPGGGSNDVFGHAVSCAGDVNGDGFADFIAEESHNGNNQTPAIVRVYSGLDGAVLFTFSGNSPFDHEFGSALSAAGDINGDGFDDFVIGNRCDSFNGVCSGSVWIRSGLDGSVLFAFHGSGPGDRFGTSLGAGGDVNGDGYPDLIVGSDGVATNPLGTGSALVFSGLDGSLLLTLNGGALELGFGGSVAMAGDVDGDGKADLIVGAPAAISNSFQSAGAGVVLSGLDGSRLLTFSGLAFFAQVGASVSSAGDVNGDGFADLLVGGPQSGSLSFGTAWVLAGGRELGLAATPFASLGTALPFSITTNPPQQGALYVIEVSLSGNAPGIPLPPPFHGSIPLNPPFLNLTYGPLLPGTFVGFTGLLDSLGQATPLLNIPNAPSLSGLVLFGAALTLDPAGPFGLGLVSNGVQVTLQ